jgi:hypothetical protein
MLPDNFDYAMIPSGSSQFTLKEVGMYSSTIEDIDYVITSWLKEDLQLSCKTNEGYTEVPVLWQAPERAYQIKNKKELRDSDSALKLPLISIERTAHYYSVDKNGRAGRFVIAKKIVPDKTRNFAVAAGTRTNNEGKKQRYFPRVNKKIVIQTISIPIPVYVNVEYKISIKTEYQQTTNEHTCYSIYRKNRSNQCAFS